MRKILANLKIKTFFGYEILAITLLIFLLTFFGVSKIHNNLVKTSSIVNTIDSNNYDTRSIMVNMNNLYIEDEKVFYECLNTGKYDSSNSKLLDNYENNFITYFNLRGINTDSINTIFNDKKVLLNEIKINKISKIHINRYKIIDSIPQVNIIETHKLFKNTKEKHISYKKYEKIDKYELMYNISIMENANINKINKYISENIKLNIKLRVIINSYISDITVKSKEKSKLGISEIRNNINIYENITYSLSILLSIVIICLIYDIEKKRSEENLDKTFIRELLNKIIKNGKNKDITKK